MQQFLLYFIGLIAGIVSAVRHYTWSDVSIMIVALFGLSMPNFWLGLVLDSMVCSRWWICFHPSF